MVPKTNFGNSKSLQKIVRRQNLLRLLETRDCPLEEFGRRHGLCRKSLYNLRRTKVESPESLLDARHFSPGRPARRDDRAMSWALAYKEAHPKAAITQVWEHLVEKFKDTGIALPSYAQLKHSFRTDYRELVDMIERGGKSWFNESAMTVRRETSRLNVGGHFKMHHLWSLQSAPLWTGLV